MERIFKNGANWIWKHLSLTDYDRAFDKVKKTRFV